MAKAFTLKAEIRESTGTKAMTKLRCKGMIPAIIYGHNEQPVTIAFDEHSFVEALHHGHRLMDVQLGRKKEKTIVKELQYDHFGRDILHVDLLRVDVKEMVKVTVPLELKGTAAGTHQSGIVEEHIDHLEIECKATDIPEVIVVSVKNLQVDGIINASDIVLPDGVVLVTSPDTIVASCHLVAAAKTTEELELETPAAPEVIGREDKEEQEEE